MYTSEPNTTFIRFSVTHILLWVNKDRQKLPNNSYVGYENLAKHLDLSLGHDISHRLEFSYIHLVDIASLKF